MMTKKVADTMNDPTLITLAVIAKHLENMVILQALRMSAEVPGSSDVVSTLMSETGDLSKLLDEVIHHAER